MMTVRPLVVLEGDEIEAPVKRDQTPVTQWERAGHTGVGGGGAVMGRALHTAAGPWGSGGYQ